MINFLDINAVKFSEESTARNTFLLVSGPRCGSSYLSSLLRSHPDIISYSELFHPRRVVLGQDHKVIPADTLLNYRKNNPVEFIESIYHRRYSSNVQAVGFKLLSTHARRSEENKLWEWLEKHKEIRILNLVRKNMLNQYLSIRQALVRQQWTSNQVAKDGPLHIALPEDQCEIMFRQTEASRLRIQSRFQSHPYLEIEYEDLISSKDSIESKILEFINVSDLPLSTSLQRMNPWTTKECIRNYSELDTFFENTPWNRFFHP